MEEAEYIEVLKEFVDRRPHTMLKLTEQGRQAFKEYRQKMKHIFEEDWSKKETDLNLSLFFCANI